MVKKLALSSILGVLTVSSAFAADARTAKTRPPLPDQVASHNGVVIIHSVTSISLQTPLTDSGSQSAPVHHIAGEMIVDPPCRNELCVGMPAPSAFTVTFNKSVTDKNLTAQRSFGACRRAIESAGPQALITLKGDFTIAASMEATDRSALLNGTLLVFSKLTECSVEKPIPISVQ